MKFESTECWFCGRERGPNAILVVSSRTVEILGLKIVAAVCEHCVSVAAGAIAAKKGEPAESPKEGNCRWRPMSEWREIPTDRAFVLFVARKSALVPVIAERIPFGGRLMVCYHDEQKGDVHAGWWPCPGFGEHDPLVVAAMEATDDD